MPRVAERRIIETRRPKSGGRERPEAAPVPRKADRVARDLLSRIVSAEVAVGSVLPKEDDLAASYGVNRSVVREAVKLLEVHRLVRPVRRRGTVVLDPVGSMSAEVLVAMLAPRAGHIDQRVLEGFLEVRAVLDAEMSALACERRTQADIRAMRALVSELQASLGDPARYAELGSDVARLVARATKNPLFEMFAAYNARVATELGPVLTITRPPSQEHVDAIRMLVDLVERREADTARRIVTEFHAWGTPRILAAAQLVSGAPLHTIPKEKRRR
jgi:DNA-binding FadR family transcriptional regulator